MQVSSIHNRLSRVIQNPIGPLVPNNTPLTVYVPKICSRPNLTTRPYTTHSYIVECHQCPRHIYTQHYGSCTRLSTATKESSGVASAFRALYLREFPSSFALSSFISLKVNKFFVHRKWLAALLSLPARAAAPLRVSFGTDCVCTFPCSRDICVISQGRRDKRRLRETNVKWIQGKSDAHSQFA